MNLECPFPVSSYPVITMAHGGGGKLTAQLVDQIFRPLFAAEALEAAHDGATFELPPGRLAFTTDSYVVQPLFFPGGDIGKLAVTGTVNDLAMCGAQARFLSCGFILEEGLATEALVRVAASMKRAALEAGVELVTGDTKVIERGRGDGLYINTSGVGVVARGRAIEPAAIRPGDAVILSGDVGRHGVAVLSEREGLRFESRVESDCAPLVGPVMALLESGVDVHCLRDLTRGGLATALVELACASGSLLECDETAVPVGSGVRGACEILGLDPLYVANEGRFVALVPAAQAPRALEALRAHEVSRGATLIGRVLESREGRARVVFNGPFGVGRVVDRLSGEQLPRIC